MGAFRTRRGASRPTPLQSTLYNVALLFQRTICYNRKLAPSEKAKIMRKLMNMQEDLQRFHLERYGIAAPHRSLPSQISTTSTSIQVDEERNSQGQLQQGISEETEDSEDDLGHYADGVKRHLTDQQISMFRHSEVYAIVRAREREQERSELEVEDKRDMQEDVVGPDGGMTITHSAISAEAASDDHQPTQIPADNVSTTSRPAQQLIPRQLNTNKNNKRKRPAADESSTTDSCAGRSLRAQVRELDFVQADAPVLDYGDGANDDTSLDLDTKLRSKEQLTPQTALHNPASPSEGRKIWWPVINV